MKQKIVGFIGGGNMACSLIGGLIADGYEPQRIWVSDLDQGKCQNLQAQFGVNTAQNNESVVAASDVVVLAVKPQVLKGVAQELRAAIEKRKCLVISIAAGVRTFDLRKWLGSQVALVRTMPNTPALVQTGATVLFAGSGVTEDQRDTAEGVMRAVGMTLWISDEAQMDTVTALSGGGPAYFFLIMEAMQEAAKELGLNEDVARLLTLQTALGAARMAVESDVRPAELRKRVTSPGGTTEQAIAVLEEHGLRSLFKDALAAARSRSEEISRMLGQD